MDDSTALIRVKKMTLSKIEENRVKKNEDLGIPDMENGEARVAAKSISGFVGERAASAVAVRAQREGAAGDSRCRAL